MLAVGILAVSGLILARLHLTAWSELVGTAYGRWLAAKIAVFAAMLALGAWHQGWVEPRLARALAARGDGAASGPRVPAERPASRPPLGLVALGLAGVLGVTAPPAPAEPSAAPGASPGFRHERVFDEARVRLEITPLRPGPNAIRLAVTDPAGRPLADATAAMVQITPVDASVGAVTFQLDRAAPGVFVAPSAALGLVGRWSGRLVVQRTNAYDVNDRFELVVAEGTAAHAHGAAHSRPSPAAPAARPPHGRRGPGDRRRDPRAVLEKPPPARGCPAPPGRDSESRRPRAGPEVIHASPSTVIRNVVCLAALTGLAGPALAHQRQLLQVGPADYLLVVGSLDEPVFTGDKSGVDLTVLVPDPANPMDSRAEKAKPVEGLEKTLKVEVKAGPHARVFELEPRFRAPGRYDAVFYPDGGHDVHATGSSARSTARPST